MKRFGNENPTFRATPISDEEGRKLVKEAENRDFELAKKLLPNKYKNNSVNSREEIAKEVLPKPNDILDLAISAEAKEVAIDSDQV